MNDFPFLRNAEKGFSNKSILYNFDIIIVGFSNNSIWYTYGLFKVFDIIIVSTLIIWVLAHMVSASEVCSGFLTFVTSVRHNTTTVKCVHKFMNKK